MGVSCTQIEMSTDGGMKWEAVSLPLNCKPYHQTMNFGEYREGITLYRRTERDGK